MFYSTKFTYERSYDLALNMTVLLSLLDAVPFSFMYIHLLLYYVQAMIFIGGDYK